MPQSFSIDSLLERMVELDASDLHLSMGAGPVVRRRGHLEPVEGYPPLSAEDTRDLLYRILSTEQQKHLEIKRQLDFAHSIPGVARFRVNSYYQREALSAAFRLIPHEIKTLEELGLPARTIPCSRWSRREHPRDSEGAFVTLKSGRII